MMKNMGSGDRLIRTIVGIIIIVLYLMGQISGLWATILLALSAILILTSMFSVCPVYMPFKLSTCKTNQE
ncbi:MAG: DUF2892 domain-containing protein [Calditrichaeota bacterium]|nr:DUF2892 domain-containing protein [Calditrichota bacterium]